MAIRLDRSQVERAMILTPVIQAVGTPEIVITPEVIDEVFRVDVAIINTPIGLQICPLAGTK